ncbi:MAG: radical SAM protein [Sideroxydans sp.]|nr:radical SAM protein [Sideroxydans sp.]
MQPPDIILVYINISSVYPNLGIASLTAYLKKRGLVVRQANLALPDMYDGKRFATLKESSWMFYQEMSTFLHEGKTAAAPSPKHQQVKKLLLLWTQYLLRDDPQSLGLSLHFDNVILSLLLAQMVKAERPGFPVIFGGPECNKVSSALFLKTEYVDSVIEGEGEQALYRVLCRLKERKLVSIPCNLKHAGTGDLFPLDIDTLPAPDFAGVVNMEKLPVALPVAFNRGCSFVCSFCDERKYWVKFRQVKVEKAIAILAQLKREFGTKRYLLSQSLLNNDLNWLKDFAVQLYQAETGVLWGGNARVHNKMDEDYFRVLYRGGCRFFYWGIESASLPVLKQMQKGTTPKTNRRVLQAAAASGLWNHTYWIIGFPTETDADLLLSVDYILENAEVIHSAIFHLYMDFGIDGLEASDSLIEYYRASEKNMLSQRSQLLEKYSAFFQRIARIMQTNLAGSEKFEGRCFDPAVLEEKRRMLAALHLLRFFIVEPGIRDELARLFTKVQFQKVYENFCREHNPSLKQLGDPQGGYGKLIFSCLAEE